MRTDARSDDGDDLFVREHIDAFNVAVASGEWAPFVERFTDDAELSFVGVPVGPFHGRHAIRAAYETSPPDDAVVASGAPRMVGDELVVPFVWRGSREPGAMRIRRRDEGISSLSVAFGSAAGIE